MNYTQTIINSIQISPHDLLQSSPLPGQPSVSTALRRKHFKPPSTNSAFRVTLRQLPSRHRSTPRSQEEATRMNSTTEKISSLAKIYKPAKTGKPISNFQNKSTMYSRLLTQEEPSQQAIQSQKMQRLLRQCEQQDMRRSIQLRG